MESRLLVLRLRKTHGAAIAVLWFSFFAITSISAAAPTIAGLRAALRDTATTYRAAKGDEHLRWRTDWTLTWTPLAQVHRYEIRLKTSEGVSRKSREESQPRFRIEVAKGDNAKAAGLLARDIQLATIESLLAVSVVAHFKDGTQSQPTPWFPVGRVFPED